MHRMIADDEFLMTRMLYEANFAKQSFMSEFQLEYM